MKAPKRPSPIASLGPTFTNPPGSPTRARRPNRVLKFIWRQRIHTRRPPVPLDHVIPEDEAAATLARHIAAGTDTVTWLGHAAFLLRLAGKTVLIDPFLSEYASPVQGVGPKRFTPPGISVGNLPPIDLLLVSHNHYDHLDAATIDALPNKESIQVVVPLGLKRFFISRGYKR